MQFHQLDCLREPDLCTRVEDVRVGLFEFWRGTGRAVGGKEGEGLPRAKVELRRKSRRADSDGEECVVPYEKIRQAFCPQAVDSTRRVSDSHVV